MKLSCPCCAQQHFSRLATYREWQEGPDKLRPGRERLMALAKELNIDVGDFYACDNCGYRRVERLPSAEQLGAFYQSYAGTPGYGKKAASKLARAKKRIAGLKSFVAKGRFLDVGFNLGYAVEAAHQLGFTASGIEIDADALAKAKARFPHCDFAVATAQGFAKTAAPYDLIYCTEVIKHVPDLTDFMSALKSLVVPGGYIYLTTPQADHFRTPKSFAAWHEVKPPEHLQWFSAKALRELLARHGFIQLRKSFSLKPGLRVTARHLP